MYVHTLILATHSDILAGLDSSTCSVLHIVLKYINGTDGAYD